MCVITAAQEAPFMARVGFNRNIGLLVLAIWLILYGLTGFLTIALPAGVLAALAIIAGVLILIGR
jgi:hypothetical protein